MSVFNNHILIVGVLCVVTFANISDRYCFGETETTSMPEPTNPKQIKIILDVWPKQILNGDCYYVTFAVENKSDRPIIVSPHDLFETFSYDGSQIPYVKNKISGIPMARFTGNGSHGSLDFPETRWINIENVTIEPKTSLIVFAERFIALINHGHMKRLEKSINDPFLVEIVNFSEEHKACVQSPPPSFQISERAETESKLIYDFLHCNMDVLGWPMVKTKSGYYSLFVFFTVQRFGPLQHTRNRDLPTLSAWREFEAKLSPGTLRDEIRLGRIQVQYLDGDKEAALNELRDWFAVMEPIQSMTLAASLCLPEGVNSENESRIMFYGVMNQPEDEALECRKHFMAMRREIDKIVAQYNTLPKRKLRETLAY